MNNNPTDGNKLALMLILLYWRPAYVNNYVLPMFYNLTGSMSIKESWIVLFGLRPVTLFTYPGSASRKWGLLANSGRSGENESKKN